MSHWHNPKAMEKKPGWQSKTMSFRGQRIGQARWNWGLEKTPGLLRTRNFGRAWVLDHHIIPYRETEASQKGTLLYKYDRMDGGGEQELAVLHSGKSVKGLTQQLSPLPFGPGITNFPTTDIDPYVVMWSQSIQPWSKRASFRLCAIQNGCIWRTGGKKEKCQWPSNLFVLQLNQHWETTVWCSRSLVS